MLSALKNNKLIKKWLELPLSFRTFVAIMCAVFFQSGMKLLFVPIFTRLLSTAEYGIVTVYESIQTTLGTFTMLSLSASVYSRGMQEFKEDRNTFTSSLLALSNLCTLIVGTIVLMFRQQIAEYISGTLLIIMFLDYLLMPAYNFWIARQKFEYKYQKMLLVTIIVYLFSPIAAVTAILSLQGDKAVIRIIGAEIILGIAYLILYINTFKKSRWKIKSSYLKYALKFNLPLIPHYASQHILTSCDRIMISAIIDSASAGIYGLSYQVASVVHIVWTSINAVLVPWEYDKIEKNKIRDIRSLSRILIILYGAVCVGVMLVAPEVIRIFAPSSYHEGIYVMAPVVAGAFFSGLYSLLAILEFYYKKNIYIMFASSFAAVLNVILNGIFIPLFGYQAAAYTTLVCYMVYALLHAFNLKRLKLAYFYDMRTIFILSVSIAIISLIVSQTYNSIVLRYLLLLLLLCIAFWKRKLILSAVKSLKKNKYKSSG